MSVGACERGSNGEGGGRKGVVRRYERVRGVKCENGACVAVLGGYVGCVESGSVRVERVGTWEGLRRGGVTGACAIMT